MCIRDSNEVFGAVKTKDTMKLNSTKSMLGHSLGAAGALEAIACLQSIAEVRSIHWSPYDPVRVVNADP